MNQEWYTIKEALGILGVSDKTLRRWIADGKIPHKKDGRKYLVFITDVPDSEEANKKDNKEQHTQETQETADNKPINEQVIGKLMQQLDEKDKQLGNANERLREAQILINQWQSKYLIGDYHSAGEDDGYTEGEMSSDSEATEMDNEGGNPSGGKDGGLTVDNTSKDITGAKKTDLKGVLDSIYKLVVIVGGAVLIGLAVNFVAKGGF